MIKLLFSPPLVYYVVAISLLLFIGIMTVYFWTMRNFQIDKFKIKTGLLETEIARKDGKGSEKPLQPVTIEMLRDDLRLGGQVNWIDRKITNVGQLHTYGQLIISGKMKSGKTREAIELISRALVEELITPDCVFKLNPSFFTFVAATKSPGEMGINPEKANLILIDDFPYHYGEAKLNRLESFLYSLRVCKDLFVMATARTDQLTEAHKGWLVSQKFQDITVPNFDADQTGRLIDSASGVFGLQIDDESRSILVENGDGRPELILLAMRRLFSQGVKQVTSEMAKKIAKESLAESWAETKRYIQKQHPHSEYLFQSLSTFYSANVTPYSFLVVQYAEKLWLIDQKQKKKLWRQLNKLKSALRYLENFEVFNKGGITSHPDFVAEGIIDPKSAEKNLGEFLLSHRRIFQSSILRWFYRNAEIQAWGLFDLGINKHERKEYQEANKLYNAAARFFPHSGIFNNLGILLAKQNRPEDAEAAYRQAIEKDPNYADAYYNLGVLLDDLNRPEGAEAAYRQAIEKDPNLAQAYSDLGVLLATQNRPEDAEAAYRQAIEKDPNLAPVYSNLGVLLDDLNRPEDAEAAYRQAIEKDPNYADAYSNLGSLLAKQNRPEDAEAAYRQAIEKDPNLAEAYSNLGSLLDDLNRPEDAEAAYRQAIEKDKNNAFYLSQLGLFLRINNRIEEAIPLFIKSNELFPRLDSVLNLAGIYRKVNNQDLMAKFLVEARNIIEAKDYYNLACLESISDNVETAFEYLRQAVLNEKFDAKWAWQDPDFEWIRSNKRFETIVSPRNK